MEAKKSNDRMQENGNHSQYSSKKSRSRSFSRSANSDSSRDQKKRSSRESSRSREDRRVKKDFTTLYVRGLNPDVQDNQFEELFASSGEIETVKIPRDPNTQKSRGFGFITYRDSESAQ